MLHLPLLGLHNRHASFWAVHETTDSIRVEFRFFLGNQFRGSDEVLNAVLSWPKRRLAVVANILVLKVCPWIERGYGIGYVYMQSCIVIIGMSGSGVPVYMGVIDLGVNAMYLGNMQCLRPTQGMPCCNHIVPPKLLY